MREGLRVLLFISAFSPAFLSLAYAKYTPDGANDIVIVQLVCIAVIGIVSALIIIRQIELRTEVFSIKVKKAESNDFMLFVFVASYFVPIIARSSEINVFTAILIVASASFVLCFVNAVPSHPLLRILKFRFYKIEAETGMVYILISRRDVLDPSNIQNVKKISTGMLMEAL